MGFRDEQHSLTEWKDFIIFVIFVVCSSSEKPESRLGKTVKIRIVEQEIVNSWYVLLSQHKSNTIEKHCTS